VSRMTSLKNDKPAHRRTIWPIVRRKFDITAILTTEGRKNVHKSMLIGIFHLRLFSHSCRKFL
jgi:hypothetical protein